MISDKTQPAGVSGRRVAEEPGGASDAFDYTTMAEKPQVSLVRLRTLAETAKIRGDQAAFWRLRRAFLLAQAAVYAEGKGGDAS